MGRLEKVEWRLCQNVKKCDTCLSANCKSKFFDLWYIAMKNCRMFTGVGKAFILQSFESQLLVIRWNMRVMSEARKSDRCYVDQCWTAFKLGIHHSDVTLEAETSNDLERLNSWSVIQAKHIVSEHIVFESNLFWRQRNSAHLDEFFWVCWSEVHNTSYKKTWRWIKTKSAWQKRVTRGGQMSWIVVHHVYEPLPILTLQRIQKSQSEVPCTGYLSKMNRVLISYGQEKPPETISTKVWPALCSSIFSLLAQGTKKGNGA